MNGTDLEIFTTLKQWLANDAPVWLCTIIATVGASPRPVGSLLIVRGNEHRGSLSGGCIEEDLLLRIANGSLNPSAPEIVQYGISADENARLGLPCGGRLTVLAEPISTLHQLWIDQACDYLAQRIAVVRQVNLTTGDCNLQPEANTPGNGASGIPSNHTATLTDREFSHLIGPKHRLLVVGAGQLAEVLTTLALALDYEITVIDPRDYAIAQWAGPDIPLIEQLPDDALAALKPDARTAIVTLSHDPRVDDMALLGALDSGASYVGALGSVRTTEKRRERLLALGVSSESLARLHAPIGMPIGSKTAWEIAVSIMAQLTQHFRHGGTQPS